GCQTSMSISILWRTLFGRSAPRKVCLVLLEQCWASLASIFRQMLATATAMTTATVA
ncbi:hypothetical protein IWW45_009274, partial [Coemansia sp. RSA 485]